MEMQLLKFRREQADRVFLMYGDDIYYDNSNGFKPTLMPYFREKPVEESKFEFMIKAAKSTFINVDKDCYYS